MRQTRCDPLGGLVRRERILDPATTYQRHRDASRSTRRVACDKSPLLRPPSPEELLRALRLLPARLSVRKVSAPLRSASIQERKNELSERTKSLSRRRALTEGLWPRSEGSTFRLRISERHLYIT